MLFLLLFKSLEFKNVFNQKIKVTDIPLFAVHPHHWVIESYLQIFISSLYNHPQEETNLSFRDYLKRKKKWSEFKDLFSDQEFKNNA